MSVKMPLPGAITHVAVESVCVACGGERLVIKMGSRFNERIKCYNCDGNGRVRAAIPLKHIKELLEALK